MKPVQHTTRSVIRNVAYGAATWLLPVILGIVATPVLVNGLGVEAYGIYALVLGLIGYSFSFGVGRAMTKYIAEYRAGGDRDAVRQIFSATLLVALIAGAAGSAIIAGFAPQLVDDLFRVTGAARDDTVLAVRVAAAVIFASIFSQAFASALQGVHRFDLYSKLLNVSSIVQVGGSIVLALYGAGLVTLLAWNALTVALTAAAGATIVRREIPEAAVTRHISGKTLSLILSFSAGTIGYQLVANALVVFERAWITRELGPDDLAYYAVAFSPGLFLQGFASSLVLMLVPMVSEYQKDIGRLTEIYKKATRLVTLFVFLLVTIVVVDSRDIMLVWVGPSFAENASGMLAVLSIAFGIVAILSVSWQMKEGLGVPGFNFAASAAALVIGIPVMIIFTREYGALGTAIGRLIAFGVMAFSLIHFEKWLFGRLFLKFWMQLLAGAAVAAIAAAAGQMLVKVVVPEGWAAIVISSGVSAIIFVSVAWALSLFAPEEKEIVRRAFSRYFS